MYADWNVKLGKTNKNINVLAASTRSLNHVYECLKVNCDAITIPLKVLDEWAKNGITAPTADFDYDSGGKEPIEYKKLDLNSSWQDYGILHELTDVGLDKFASDWNNLIQ